MPISIESAGDHDFDLRHIRQQGGDELIGLLLDRADLPPHLPWRLQVQKKLTCNAETPPVRVVDEPRKWAVHLKIKPGDNDSCHLCSLLMPDGLQGERVYFQLGEASVQFDRNWRYGNVGPANGAPPNPFTKLFRNVPDVEATPPPLPAASPLPEGPPPVEGMPTYTTEASPVATPEADAGGMPGSERPPSGCARGWVGDVEKMRLLLLAIHEINEEGTYPQDQWVEFLCQRMNWQDANRHEIGGVLTSLVRKGFVERRIQKSKPFGYLLSEEGGRLIADLVDRALSPPSAPLSCARPSSAVQASREPDGPAHIIRSFGAIAKQFLEANTRLEEITRREQDLLAELDLLQEEREQICRLLDDHQVQSALASLTRLVPPKQLG